MEEELDQFAKNNVWDLVPKPKGTHVIGTKWVYRNKLNEKGEVVRNKGRMVPQGYNQQEGIDYNETFSPVTREAGERLHACLAREAEERARKEADEKAILEEEEKAREASEKVSVEAAVVVEAEAKAKVDAEEAACIVAEEFPRLRMLL
ncbi:uncharacterized mitochondrial protein AtMg00820-like [Lathyrus oleraceus]|uniref:uncharacterized mitochondrial protein AtMg00820-like n=1 Tax=Pisum sativum TaxID=3888 RepID=UPI0021D3E53B|nr:uncharacterized mitochondrial protein AtMg00820-like [Pisum sativum]